MGRRDCAQADGHGNEVEIVPETTCHVVIQDGPGERVRHGDTLNLKKSSQILFENILSNFSKQEQTAKVS